MFENFKSESNTHPIILLTILTITIGLLGPSKLLVVLETLLKKIHEKTVNSCSQAFQCHCIRVHKLSTRN